MLGSVDRVNKAGSLWPEVVRSLSIDFFPSSRVNLDRSNRATKLGLINAGRFTLADKLLLQQLRGGIRYLNFEQSTHKNHPIAFSRHKNMLPPRPALVPRQTHRIYVAYCRSIYRPVWVSSIALLQGTDKQRDEWDRNRSLCLLCGPGGRDPRPVFSSNRNNALLERRGKTTFGGIVYRRVRSWLCHKKFIHPHGL